METATEKLNDELCILLVEDVGADVELELRELRQAGLHITAKIVETEPDFRREIETFDPDIVLSDFSLPHFSGMAALNIVRELRPDLPFIFVSGTIGEENAVEALRNGATDYILKNNLKRFPAAVQRAIAEARARIAHRLEEQRARKMERYFALFMRHVPATAFTKDLDGRFVYVNPTFEALVGKSNDELRGLTSRDLYPAELVAPILENDRKVIEGKRAVSAIEKIQIGGTQRHFLVNRFPIPNESGEIELLGGISQDVTPLVEAERALAESEARFRGIVETTEERIWECNLQCTLTYNNSALTRILGYTPAEVLGKSSLEFLQEDHRRAVKKAMRPKTATREGWRGIVVKARHKDGRIRWLESNGQPLFDAQGRLTGFRGADRDITERIEHEAKLTRLSRIRDLTSRVNVAITRLKRKEDLLVEICRVAVEVGGLKMAWAGLVDLAGERIEPIAWHGLNDKLKNALNLSLKDGDPEARSLAVEACRAGRALVENDVESSSLGSKWRERTLANGHRSGIGLPLTSLGKTTGVVALFSEEANYFDVEEQQLFSDLVADVSLALENMERREQLDYLAYYDSLTGSANRALFQERLQQFLHEAKRAGLLVAVAILDLQRFRMVNESLGRAAGDKLLKLVAERLAKHCEAERVGRIGMNFFGVVLPNASDGIHAGRLVEELCRRPFLDPFELDGRDLRVSVRCGVAVFPSDGNDAESLLRNAEAALTQAKQAGDTTAYYTQKLNADVAERLTLENKLRRAVEERRFVLHYQPKVSLSNGGIEGVEALIRWNDPESGLVLPARFIPILEETGLIHEVGQWALEEAARAFRRWEDEGLQAARIAVNVSAIQLRQKDFAKRIEDAVGSRNRATGVDIEITESMIMQDVERNIATLQAVRDLGVMIAVDDFGTGYSSLSYLARLPIDYLKIDRSFIHNMIDSPDDLEIASAIVSMGRSLGLKTVAEGVENKEQADLLKALGCDQMQGFYFSPAVPEERLIEVLAPAER